MTVRIYPGMLDQSTEYFNHENDVFVIQDGEIKKFEEVSFHPGLDKILSEESDLHNLLQKWFGNDNQVKLRTIARCRFGALNFTPDFKEEQVSHDYCECEYRGNCEGENIICKSVKLKGKEISDDEILLLQV